MRNRNCDAKDNDKTDADRAHPTGDSKLSRAKTNGSLENNIAGITGCEALGLDDTVSATKRRERPIAVDLKVVILIGEQRHSGLATKAQRRGGAADEAPKTKET